MKHYVVCAVCSAVLSGCSVLAVGCNGRGNYGRGAESVVESAVVSGDSDAADGAAGGDAAVPHFEPPVVPPMMLSDSAGIEFVARHWWDNLDCTDPAWLADTVVLESAFYMWAEALAAMPADRAVPLAGEFISRGRDVPAMQLRMLDVVEYFWHHPNSPFRNEYLLESALTAVVAAPKIDETDKLRPRKMLEAVRRNRPGTLASDIAFTTAAGRQGTLYGIGSDYLLLMLYQPGCPECARLERYIPRSEVLSPLLASGRLKVLAVYPEADVAAWRAHLPQMPARWIVAHAPLVEQRSLAYDLSGIPALYLLDRDKRVLLKDAGCEQVEEWFVRHADALAAGLTLTAEPVAPAADSPISAATAADADAAACFAWDRTECDMGEIGLGQTRSTRFMLRAEGGVVVVLAAAADCDCTRAEIPRRPLREGDEVPITVSFSAEERGDFRKTVRVDLNVGGRECTSTLAIHGRVI